MIVTPPGFLPDQNAADDAEAVAHVFIRDRLVQRADTPALLPFDAYRDLGLAQRHRLVIGRYQDRTHVAVALDADAVPETLPAGWRAGGLRSWFGQLPDPHIAIAMRGAQLLDFMRTHRFCRARGPPTAEGPGAPA